MNCNSNDRDCGEYGRYMSDDDQRGGRASTGTPRVSSSRQEDDYRPSGSSSRGGGSQHNDDQRGWFGDSRRRPLRVVQPLIFADLPEHQRPC
ncbi:MAG: hypothetical protein ORN49_03555 [Rhodobacteraceae bacterium]|nr:hypothetical protein [Paracoccaceae bacterium]